MGENSDSRRFLQPNAYFLTILISSGALLTLSLVTLWYFTPAWHYVRETFASEDPLFLFKRQVLWILFGIVALVATKAVSPIVIRYGWSFVFLTPLLLMAAFIPGAGTIYAGVARYVEIMGIEFNTGLWATLLAVPATATFFAWIDCNKRMKWPRVGLFLWIVLVVLIFAGQSNLPMLALFCAVVAGTACIARRNKCGKLFVVGTALALIASVFAYAVISRPFRFERVKELYSWQTNPLGHGYQSQMTILDVASSGLTGQGLGSFNSEDFKTYVMPYSVTTNMVRLTVHQFGSIGVVIVIALLGAIGWAGRRIARCEKDDVAYTIKMGALLFILAQTFFSIVRTYNLIPFVPSHYIPFLSYGLESTVAGFVSLGILLGRTNNQADNTLPEKTSNDVQRREEMV